MHGGARGRRRSRSVGIARFRGSLYARRVSAHSSAVLLGLVLGCDTQVWDFDAGSKSSGRGGTTDLDAATAPPCEAGVCACAAPQLQCADSCIDPTSTSLHCGACDKACAEGELCRESVCQCMPQTTRCGALCANILTSPLHCGGCNQPCTGSQLCQNGQCL